MCDNAICVTVYSHRLLFKDKTRKGAKLALCKTMPLSKKDNENKSKRHCKHRHRQNVTSHHFTSFLFTSMSILTSLALINWKANTIHIHISNNSTFPFISLHFILSLLLSIERQKQYKYINKAIQKVQSSSYIFVIDPDKFVILWNQGYTKS